MRAILWFCGLWVFWLPAHADPMPATWRVAYVPAAPYLAAGANGAPVGYFADLLHAIAEGRGAELAFRPYPGEGEAVAAVAAGRADLVPGLKGTPQDRLALALTGPALWKTTSLYTRRPRAAEMSGSLPQGTRLGILRGTSVDRAAARLAGAHPVVFEEAVSLAIALAAGEVDAAVVADPHMARVAAVLDVPARLARAGPPLWRDPLVIGVGRGDTVLLKSLSDALERFGDGPGQTRLESRWLAPTVPGIADLRIRQALVLVAGGGLALALAALGVVAHRARRHLAAAHLRLARAEDASAAAVDSLRAALADRRAEMRRLVDRLDADLRVPMVTVAGFAANARRALAQTDGDRATRAVERISASVDRMAEVIDALLDHERLADRAAEAAPVDLDELVAKVADDLAPAIDAQDARLLLPALPQVVSDPHLLSRALHVLIENALRHGTAARGQVVEVLHREAPDGLHMLGVRDQGPGIPAADRERVFDSFRSLRPGGTAGVGLSALAQIATLLGGSAWADPPAEGGATVWFSFRPAPRPAVGRAEAA